MKSDNYKITQYSVSSILNYVENSQIAIPEIQRPFVWKGEEVRALIDSLYEGYPIGYLIVWQNSQVRVRGFGKGGTKKILIDGQQRVTALMAALLGKEVLDLLDSLKKNIKRRIQEKISHLWKNPWIH